SLVTVNGVLQQQQQESREQSDGNRSDSNVNIVDGDLSSISSVSKQSKPTKTIVSSSENLSPFSNKIVTRSSSKQNFKSCVSEPFLCDRIEKNNLIEDSNQSEEKRIKIIWIEKHRKI
ncbi:hypothetical protein SSS_01102, partial [Sarcoptes scabiei]